MATKSSRAITVENAEEYLQWLPEYRIIICLEHQYAVRSVAHHLRIYHSGTDVVKKAVVALLASHDLHVPKDVPAPKPLGVPFPQLGDPLHAFICDEPECERISVSRDEIRKHCNKDHGWKSSKEDREHWHPVWVQTFFKAAGLQRYFTVQYDNLHS